MKYSLASVDGNAFSIIGYTAYALRQEKLSGLIDRMREEATSGDYQHLLSVCSEYIDWANRTAITRGYLG